MSEQDIVNAILDYLHIHGAIATRVNSGVRIIQGSNGSKYAFRGAPKGTADIIACWPGGLYMAIEVKTKNGKTSPEQDIFLQTVRDAGGLAIVARSSDDVESALRERRKLCQT